MEKPTYTVITFAPVQGFIEKSRKLRDLYGSSYLLSLLSWAICRGAQTQGCSVVSPALPSITQGMPNQIILKGKLSEDGVKEIKSTFYLTWRIITNTCRKWIEENLNQWEYAWGRNWDLWGHHAWEFFSAQGKPGDTITEVRQLINQAKSSRNWTGINWQGESSTLSGADAIAYPELGRMIDPRQYNYQQEKQNITRFYQELSRKLGEVLVRENNQSSANNSAEKKEDNSQLSESEEEKKKQELIQQYGSTFINIREQLSIPELTKRLITHKTILENFQKELKLEENREVFGELPLNINLIAKELNPKTFKDLNRHKEEQEESKYWTGWFQGDGDGAGKYFQSLKEQEEEKLTNKFSEEMRDWGNKLMKQQREKLPGKSRMIYAGGDDFLGILYEENQQIQPLDCLQWFYTFKSAIWHWPEEKKITPSVGFVWSGSQVPQRDILQHCHEAEKSAKNKGRDRIAFRVLFNSGNYLEWVCPWWVLDVSDLEKLSKNSSDTKTPKEAKIETSVNLIESYQDRNNEKNWTHFYQDVALLESRHAFDSKKIIDIALGLIEIYFSQEWYEIIANPKNWFNRYDKNKLQTFTGILGDPKKLDSNCSNDLTDKTIQKLTNHHKVKQAFNNWVINLAKVGFRLTEDKKS
ncbi:MAG: CRISPR-associated protein Cas10 [Trichodesmium sp. MAG_R03]|nr:CRISPR-associated protein Cas10 [Trichodesmium sp. MAG_R03]